MPTKKKKTIEKIPSVGTLAIIETLDGDVRLAVDVDQQDHTSEHIMSRIRAAISGLAYFYNKDHENIESHGYAYIEGIGIGIERAEQMMNKEVEPSEGDGNQTMGFFSK